jgi:hypothetical protein
MRGRRRRGEHEVTPNQRWRRRDAWRAAAGGREVTMNQR